MRSPLQRYVLCASAFLASMLALAPRADAESQEYINSLRSNSGNNVYVLMSADGEYGKYTLRGKTVDAQGNKQPYATNETWQGYGLTTSVGVELIHFMQVEVGHTLLITKHSGDEPENMNGSRLHLGVRFAFASPAGNLEFGTGVTGSNLSYTEGLTAATMVGTGHYYSIGLNYFLSTGVSVFAEGKLLDEHLLNNAGAATVSTIDAVTSVGSFGVRIWL